MLSNFMKEAFKRGDVKKYNDVKCTDPNILEDDCPEFYIGEKIESSYDYEIGDIVFVPDYEYESDVNGHNHLFVIVDEDNYAVPITYFCMILSSNLYKLGYKQNILLKKNDIKMVIGKASKEKIEEFKNTYLKGSKHE